MRNTLNRREMLTAVTVAGMGLSIEVRGDDRVVSRIQEGRKQEMFPVIGFMLDGGMSQAEFVDAKEHPKYDYDSEVGSVPTKTEAVFSKAMEPLTPQAERLTILRTIHGSNDHIQSHKDILQLPDEETTLHRDLGKTYNPAGYGYVYMESSFEGHGDALSGIPNQVRDWFHRFHERKKAAESHYEAGSYQPLRMGLTLPEERFRSRKQLLEALGTPMTHETTRMQEMEQFNRQAFQLLLGKQTTAFAEPPKQALDRYGDNTFGRAAYIAGRLVNDGAGSIMIRNGHWDMHDNIRRLMLQGGPKLAQAMGALIEDIHTGEVKSSVVWAAGDIGRGPKINRDGGRDHWSTSSGLLYGGTLQPGVFGETDGEWKPKDKKYDKPDLQHIIRAAARRPAVSDVDVAKKYPELFTNE